MRCWSRLILKLLIVVTSLAAIWNMRRSFRSFNHTTTSRTFTEASKAQNILKNCTGMRSNLLPIPPPNLSINMSEVENKYPEVHLGGWYAPEDCRAAHKVAIIVPYRDRMNQLTIFLNYMHPFLMNQNIEYGIFIVHQNGSPFNRAKLFNVGFTESNRLKTGGWECFVFHDVDLLPLDGRNLYTCPRQPRHMSVAVDKFSYKLPYYEIFGGVSAMSYEQFRNVNGFSNKYWGWGGEDDDMASRLKMKNYHIARYKMSLARYSMLKHKGAVGNPKRFQLLSQSKMFQNDGLSTLRYEVVEIKQRHLYSHILVNIDEN